MKFPKLPSYWAGFLTAGAIAGLWIFILSPQWGANVESAHWMPEGASRGAYAHGGSLLAIGPPVYYREYDISEPDMIRYFDENGWEYHEIKEPQTQARYLSFFRVDPVRAGVEDGGIHVTVKNGLYHESDSGSLGRRLLYDREKGRAYYRFDSR